MSNEMIRQTIFTTGEVDVINYKRTDFQDYLTGAQSLLNVIVGTTGLAKKRPGTKLLLVISSYVTDNSQLYEFQDINGNFYVIVSSNLFFHIFSINGDNVVFYQTVATPYIDAHLQQIDFANDNDVIVLTHPSYPSSRIYVSSYSPVVFTYQALNIYPQPAYDFGNINYNNFTVNANQVGSVLTLQFTGLGSDPGFNAAWIGGQIIGGGATPDDPVGYAIITAVSYGAGTTTFTATVQIDFKSPGSTSGSQYSIRQPVFTAALGYPSKVIFYQNRLWLANTKNLNDTIFGSKLNAPTNFDVGIGNDTDAIIYGIGQSDSGGIVWLNGGKQLEVYTKNYEFVAPQQQDSGLTPSTFAIRQQSAYGASENVKPSTYINDSYYVTKTGKAIINFHFEGIGQAYMSSNVSVASSHLVKNPINNALQRGTDTSQDNYIFYLNDDNSVTAFQFAAEYKLAALTPIQFDTELNPVDILDIVSINNEIYFLKKYVLTGVTVLEKFVNDFKIDSYENNTMASSGLITGLDNLDGYTVQVFFQNQDFGQYMVENGQIIVDNLNEYSGAVQVGLLYFLQITPMYLFAGANGSNNFKNISQIYVDYFNSLNFYVNGKLVNYQYFADIQAGLPLQPKTGTVVMDSVDGWNRFSNFTITQNSPFDCQILGIAYQISSAII